VKSRPVGYQFALKMQNRVTSRHIQVSADPFISMNCPDPLFPILDFDLEGPAQNIKKRLIFEFAITESGQINIRQVIQIIKNRLFINQA
jgi:hypothetical protein